MIFLSKFTNFSKIDELNSQFFINSAIINWLFFTYQSNNRKNMEGIAASRWQEVGLRPACVQRECHKWFLENMIRRQILYDTPLACNGFAHVLVSIVSPGICCHSRFFLVFLICFFVLYFSIGVCILLLVFCFSRFFQWLSFIFLVFPSFQFL